MKIGRTLPPVAIPMNWKQIWNGLVGWRRGKQEVNRFRQELRSYFSGRQCFLVSSGKAALYCVLKALKTLHPERNEVLIPAFTCYSVPAAIVRAGLTVRLCDVNPQTLDFDHQQLRMLLQNDDGTDRDTGSRLLAIVPTHLFGLKANIARLRHLINDTRVIIIEDAAQAFGARNGESMVGNAGDIGIFSLGRGKAFSTITGGVIVTDRTDLADIIKDHINQLPTAGATDQAFLLAYAIAMWLMLSPSLFWMPRTLPFLHLGETIYDPGFKIKSFSPFQAGLARGWKLHLDQLRATRKTQAKAWRRHLKTLSAAPFVPEEAQENLIRYPLFVPAQCRAALLSQAEKSGLGISPGYPDCIAGIAQLKARLNGDDCPQARKLARELITLPVHPFVTETDRIKAVRLISACIDQK